MKYLFTSESVSEGHPDKMADQISDAILDEFLAFDLNSKVACETLVTTGQVVVAGEIKSRSIIDHDNTLKNFSSTGPGVTTGGNTQLGQCSHLGIGSTVKHQILIGDNTIVGAQSLVVKNCENNSVYFGIPAKKIKNREDNSKYL